MSVFKGKIPRSSSEALTISQYSHLTQELSLSLPRDFATNLLNKELESQKDCSIQTITELVNLYREAIEYYEHINDPKFFYYQEKMHKFLLRSDILNAMQLENNRLKATRSTITRSRANTVRKPRNQPIKSVPEHRELSSIEIHNTVASISPPKIATISPKKIDKIMVQNESESKNTKIKAVDNFKSQELSLEERLASRKMRSLNASLDLSLQQESESPIKLREITYEDFFKDIDEETRDSGLSSRSSFKVNDINVESRKNGFSPDILEKKLEDVMEKHHLEKIEIISEIKLKYERKIQVLNDSGSATKAKLNEIRKDMSDEIEIANKALDESRKTELFRLKEEMYTIEYD